MKKFLARVVALATVATAALAATGTGGATTPFTLKYAVTQPFSAGQLATLDPAKSQSTPAWQAEYLTCANLFAHPDVDLQTGGSAISEVSDGQPDVSDDGLTYTFLVKSGYAFSNGTPVTPSAYSTEINRLKDSAVNSPGAIYAADITNASPDDAASTLTITLSAPHADLLDRLAMPYFCPVPPGTGASPTLPLPSSGPYKIGATTPGSVLTLAQNSFYPGTRPRNATAIEFVQVADGATARAGVDAGTYDLAETLDDPSYATANSTWGRDSTNAQQGHQRFFLQPNNQLNYLALNTTRGLGNEKLRRAINYAIDRNALVGMGSPLANTAWSQFLTPGIPGFAGAANPFPLSPNIATAQTLVATSGATDKSLTIYCSGLVRCNQANTISSNLQAVGFGPITVTTPSNFFGAISSPAGWDIALISWIADYTDPTNFIVPLMHRDSRPPAPSASNYSYWDSSSATDANGTTWTNRMDTARAASFTPDRYSAFGQLATELLSPAPIAAWSHGNWRFYVSDRLRCVTVNPAVGIALGTLCVPDVSGPVSSGETVSSPGTVSSSNPVVSSVTSPVSGTVSISETTTLNDPPPTGYSFLGQQVTIEAPQATPANPLVLSFDVDSSVLNGMDPTTLTLFRNGEAISYCADPSGSAATPDPCVVGPPTATGTGWRYTVRTSHASRWNFGRKFNFGGFQQPVDLQPTFNKMKAGAAVPVKFSLGANLGLDIFGAAYPKSAGVACPNSSAPVDLVEQTVASETSSLSYDATANRYTYTWKTQKAWASSCRQLILRFADGSEQRANFQFTK